MRIIGAFATVEANVKYVCDAMNVHPKAEQIAKSVEIRMKYIRQALQPRSGATAMLNQLRNQGYKLGLVSNCSIEIPILWHETAFANSFDAPIFSGRVHLRKPDPRIYQLACERLKVRPDTCLYVGDGEDHELAAAANVGLHPVLIRTGSQEKTSKSHQEARDWQGLTIASLPEVLQLVES